MEAHRAVPVVLGLESFLGTGEDPDEPSVEVDVGPLEVQDLAFPQAGEEPETDDRPEAGVSDPFEKLACLLARGT